MQFGVHLPQISWEDEPLALDRLIAVATAAERFGFGTVSANDHVVYGQPWLDGPEVAGRLPIGSPAACLDLLGRYQGAGLQRVLLWPVKDEVQQLERVALEIIPQLGGAS